MNALKTKGIIGVVCSLILGIAPSAWAAPFDVETKLAGSDTAAGHQFGTSVGISGDVAIVGALFDDDAGNFSGSAYLFDVRTGEEFFKLSASDAAADDRFGQSVGIDGNRAIVGAPRKDAEGINSGSAYLFDADPLSSTFGVEVLKLTASDTVAGDLFGGSVAISDGTAIVGAVGDDDGGNNSSGSAYLFDVATGNELFKLTASDAATRENFGIAVAISASTAIVGKYRDHGTSIKSGAAYLFDVNTGNQLHKLTASDAAEFDNFGLSVGISGNTAIVGANKHGDVGFSSGSAYVFDVTTGEQLFKLTASDATEFDQFGKSVDISDGIAIVGAHGEDRRGDNLSGSAYLFDVTTGFELLKLTASDAAFADQFGDSVGISGGTVIVGANADDNPALNSGSAYLFGIPEPSSFVLAAFALVGLVAYGCRRRRE